MAPVVDELMSVVRCLATRLPTSRLRVQHTAPHPRRDYMVSLLRFPSFSSSPSFLRAGQIRLSNQVAARMNIFYNIFMPTSVHIPSDLLKQADQRAQALGISRNRLIVRALERELKSSSEWAPAFLAQLRSVSPEMAPAADELLAAVHSNRRSKPPVHF